jgi:4'-phosphopantetheinyl transferase
MLPDSMRSRQRLVSDPVRPVASDTAHLWSLDTEVFQEAATAHAWLALLEDHERLRYATYATSAARREYLAARALARTALAHYSGKPAHALRFRIDHLGRPELTSPPMPGLRFSLSKTTGLVVGLFAFDREVGVDLELVSPIAVIEMAECHYTSAEQEELLALQDAARLSRFYELWTLREAYLKARGIGLLLPLHELAFHPSAPGGVRAAFGRVIGDDPARWQFDLTWLADRHVVATCIGRASAGAPTRLICCDARGVNRVTG